MEDNKNITQFNSGLNQDIAPQFQPKDTYRFALNAVNKDNNNINLLTNEESNILSTQLKENFIPIGKCYMGNNRNVIFSASTKNNISEIGLLNDKCEYEVLVNDELSSPKDRLNFKVTHQIQATYRLRRGCERTLYFTDGLNTPRYFNIDKPSQFKTNGNWSGDKFGLYKKLKIFPTVDSVEVLDNSGSLIPGSYTILVQHLDEDFNGTEFYELVKNINIYNDPLNKTFSEIQGSSNIGEEGQPYKYINTSKAIKITLDAIDKSFTYIRFAFVERNSGNGLVSSVKYSDPISSQSPTYIYTGKNAATTGTIEEVELFNMNAGIQAAKHIEQIDNMLILSNIQGAQEELCKLQKYASKITTDCFIKDTILTTIKENHNPKNPLVVYNGVGYQPGDIYSLGINYIFEDYSISPTFHIPGKSPDVSNTKVFSPGTNVYPMSNNNNRNSSEFYIDENSSCSELNYWGVDSEGVDLKNKNVRHHRFPTRNDLGINFVRRTETTGNISNYKRINLSAINLPKRSEEGVYIAKNYRLTVKYLVDGVEESFYQDVYPDSNIPVGTVLSNIYSDTSIITDIKLFYREENTTIDVEIPLVDGESAIQDNEAKYKITVNNLSENNINSIYKATIFGLKFSNIELPPEEEIGKKIIGYQIVRQERTDDDKNILDSAVAFPMTKSGRNTTTAMLGPEYFTKTEDVIPGIYSTCENSTNNEFPTCYNISKNNLMLVTPTHRFMDKTHDGFTSIKQVGVFNKEYVARRATSIQNVFEGTSASGEEESSTKDNDGFSLRHGYRFTGVKYSDTIIGTPLEITNEGARMYNLQGVNYAESEDNTETLYNLSFDNKALIVSSSKPDVDFNSYKPDNHKYPYMYIMKDNSTFYQGFRNNPYYLVSTEVFTESTCKVFGGDTFIVPMRYSNHIYGGAVAAIRRNKVNAWQWIGSLLIAALGVALAAFTGGGTLLIAGGILIALGAVTTFVATMIESSKFSEIYGDKWQANLDRTVFDFPYAHIFVREHPQDPQPSYNPDPRYQPWADDTFRWWGDIVGDLWFETTLNVSLRVPPTNMENNYLLPLKSYMGDSTGDFINVMGSTEYLSNQTPFGGQNIRRYYDRDIMPSQPEEWYFTRKITESDKDKTSGLKFTGMSVPQIYLINPDHAVTVGIKKYYTIPLQYDCCSECKEKFPHRIHYSLQSFQEEKTDNYRMFLPNNYRDIEGETGEITNIFRLYNNLYAHTEEALWQMSRNYQERVTDQVVSFIGTGSYFEIPPQKIVDDNTGNSAGTQHKWSSIKTPNGYFFVTENQRKIYNFSGKNLNPISDIGLSNWFKNHIEIINQGNPDNPSNPEGTGYISTYDSRKERIIFTKLDKSETENYSWTISYSLKTKSWISWHSYIPNFYVNTTDNFYSFNRDNKIWKHNVIGHYQTFYSTLNPFIIDYVSTSEGLKTRVWDSIDFILDSKQFDQNSEEFSHTNIFFNKAVFYNTTQCSGLLNIIQKDNESKDYYFNQTNNLQVDEIIVDRNEKNWSINEMRDIRINYEKPVWNQNISTNDSGIYIDKVLNVDTLDWNKDWSQLENFRDKFLAVRLIFDKFANTKLIMNFSSENENPSLR